MPPTASKTFGYHRGEILAAFVNGLVLWLIVGLIVAEAYQRFFNPPVVRSAGMIGIAVVGLGVNLASMWVLAALAGHEPQPARRLRARDRRRARIGRRHPGRGCDPALWGWYVADPLVSIGIGLLILFSSWGIVRESVDILMQGTPREMRLADIEQCLLRHSRCAVRCTTCTCGR